MYDESFWNERYAGDAYMYGKAPNTFLVDSLAYLCGPVLSISEGEGRNAVYLAESGLEVLGVDISSVGLAKAQQLAEARGVCIQTEVADLASYQPPANHFGSVVSISAHLPGDVRSHLYPLLQQALKPQGTLVLEAYSEKQLDYSTGGPKNPDMLMSLEKLRKEFRQLEVLHMQELEREIHEGAGHSGLAAVVQFIARKK